MSCWISDDEDGTNVGQELQGQSSKAMIGEMRDSIIDNWT